MGAPDLGEPASSVTHDQLDRASRGIDDRPERTTRPRRRGPGSRERGARAEARGVQRAVRALGAQPVVRPRARPGDGHNAASQALEPRGAGGDGVDLRAPVPRRVQRGPTARALPARRAELRRRSSLLATQVSDEHRHLQAVLRIYEEVFGVQRRDRRRARGRRPQHGPRRRARCTSASIHYVGHLSVELGRGRLPRGRRRLPPAGRGRDRPDGAEPRRRPVRAAVVPRPRRGAAPRRPRRGTPHRDRRDLRAASAWSGTPSARAA